MAHRIIVKGEDLGVWDLDDLLLSEAFVIKAATGLDPATLQDGLGRADPACVQAIAWFLMRKRNLNLALKDVDFRYREFDVEPVEEAEPADPTEPPETSG